MEIYPGIGTDIIRFGKKEVEAVSLLGQPDKIYITDSECRRLQYNKLLLELSFEPENENRLGWIEVHHPDAILNQRKIMGISQNMALDFVSKLLNETPQIEDYGFSAYVLYEENWVELQFQFDLLRSINIGVLYDENDLPIWPDN